MAILNEDQKLYIVKLLAGFLKPSAVVVRMREDCAVDVDRSQVIRYDPTKPSYEGGDKWRQVFSSAREAYLSQIEEVPIAHKAFRLNALQNNYDRASAAGNIPLVNAVLRLAAEEVGGALTNNLNITQGTAGAAADMTADERRAALVELIRRVQEQSVTEQRPKCLRE